MFSKYFKSFTGERQFLFEFQTQRKEPTTSFGMQSHCLLADIGQQSKHINQSSINNINFDLKLEVQYKMKQELQTTNPDLFSAIRRNLNTLKEKQSQTRKQALDQLLKIIKEEHLSSNQFEELGHIAIKQLLRLFADNSQYNREHSVVAVLELISRCGNIRSFLPYIFAVMTDRTNCTDLEGIANLPEKMRPAPGQKPKVLLKLVENCEEIRLLYCGLMKRILSLVEEDDIRDKLDEIVNILRALIMDPAPEVQKNACEVLQFFCKSFKMILLHYTEIMGRAVLLPLVSKKSKIRIAGLNALTSIFWCGLWKYNAFVFQNLIGFRDPNTVPIKDFYEPSNNINYLATFINDQNVKVRQQFMRHIKIWTCQLDDKYDHHGRIVPYMLSGLFDKDEIVKQTALETIEEIGKQIQQEKQKELRDSKQYAIDAAWTWDGLLVNLPTQSPLIGRPSLGSRVFVRGHVRKFWTALYKQIKDIHLDNRIRAAYLMLYGTIFTEHYMTQYLDVMIPHLLSSAVANQPEDQSVAQIIRRILHLIGRYCEVSAYAHIISSALKGELIQNQQFLKAAMKGLTQLVNGAFEAIPEGTGLCHKKVQIQALLSMIDDCGICSQIYKSNSLQGLQLSEAFLSGLQQKAFKQQIQELLQSHSLSVLRLLAVSFYQLSFGQLFAKDLNQPQKISKSHPTWQLMSSQFNLLKSIYPSYFSTAEDFMQQAYLNPPALMDADWKLIVFIHNVLSEWTSEQEHILFKLAQEVIICSLTTNRSIEMLTFIFRYLSYLFQKNQHKDKLPLVHQIVRAAIQNLLIFDPVKKVPVYDQHLLRPQTDPSLIRVTDEVYAPLFIGCSLAIQAFYSNKVLIASKHLAQILHLYFAAFKKYTRNSCMIAESIRTIWLLLQRSNLDQSHLNDLCIESSERIVATEELIDFLVERLETLNEPQQAQINMVFDSLIKVIKCCPKIENAAAKLLHFYAGYPSLLQKLFKYALDQRDLQSKTRYQELLIVMCGKLRPWFELQLRLSQEKSRFARGNLLKSILERAK